KYSDAEKAMERAIKIDKAPGQKPGRSIGEDLNDMGLIYDKLEKYDKAANMYKQAIDEKEKVVGKEHYSVATSCQNLGEIMDKKGNKEEWRNLSLRAARIWAQYLGINFAGSRDQMEEYIEMMHRTPYEYEMPNADTRFDGMRPYLGRY
ncbi:MAG: tetratricopeptide repeat protein, partial [Terriglobales bacterium]